MGRIYTLTAEAISVTSSIFGDLLSVQGAANRPFIVHSCIVTQREEELALQARIRLVRRSAATSATASGTVGVSKHQATDASFGATLSMARLSATPGLGTETGRLYAGSESLPNGLVYRPTPQEIQMFCADFFCVELPAVTGLGTTITVDVTAVVEEFG